jgi:hypothetical protein
MQQILPLPKLKDRKPKEADITREIRGYLKMQGIPHYKQWQGLGSLKGVSDIIGCYFGRYFAIEVKAPGRGLSENQQGFIQWVNDAGGLAFVAHSVAEVAEKLK